MLYWMTQTLPFNHSRLIPFAIIDDSEEIIKKQKKKKQK